MVSASLNGSDIDLSWPSLGPGIDYYIYSSIMRDGFFRDLYAVLNGGMPVSATMYTDIGAASSPGDNYYLIVPYNLTLGNGSSTYSVGVITDEFDGNDFFGLPLKPVWGDLSADWYTDQIPNALGIVYLENGIWTPHFKEFDEGVYDTIIEYGRGYEVSVYISSLFNFIGR